MDLGTPQLSISAVTGDGPDPSRITSHLVISGAALDTVQSARLLDTAEKVIGELVISEARGESLQAQIPQSLATAITASPSSHFYVELLSATATARQEVQILRGEAGPTGSTGPTGPPGTPATITASSCPLGQLVSGISASGDLVCVSDQLNAGTITSVIAGSGLEGGGNSGAVTLSIGAAGITGGMIANAQLGPEKLTSPFRHSTNQYYVLAPADFRPENGTATVTYDLTSDGNYGALVTSGGSASSTAGVAIAPLHLPAGAQIQALSCEVNTETAGTHAKLLSQTWNSVATVTTHMTTSSSDNQVGEDTLSVSGQAVDWNSQRKYTVQVVQPYVDGTDGFNLHGCLVTYR